MTAKAITLGTSEEKTALYRQSILVSVKIYKNSKCSKWVSHEYSGRSISVVGYGFCVCVCVRLTLAIKCDLTKSSKSWIYQLYCVSKEIDLHAKYIKRRKSRIYNITFGYYV